MLGRVFLKRKTPLLYSLFSRKTWKNDVFTKNVKIVFARKAVFSIFEKRPIFAFTLHFFKWFFKIWKIVNFSRAFFTFWKNVKNFRRVARKKTFFRKTWFFEIERPILTDSTRRIEVEKRPVFLLTQQRPIKSLVLYVPRLLT